MRFAYLIHAHGDLDQLSSLIARLLRDDPDDIIIVHVDRRSSITDRALEELRAAVSSRFVITPRVKCRWGHPSLCEAAVILMETLDGIKYDYAHLISGQDWPIGPKASMVADIDPGACYVTLKDAGLAERMNDYHFYNRLLPPSAHSPNWKPLRQALLFASRGWTLATRFLGKSRQCPFGPAWQRGSAWWSLPPEVVRFLAASMAAMLQSGRLRYTLCSDEHVPQTILAYSPFADRIRPNRRFMIWNGASPKILAAEHLPLIEGSQCWFARKVSLSRDPFFLNL